jgi:hypothetical protein
MRSKSVMLLVMSLVGSQVWKVVGFSGDKASVEAVVGLSREE